MQLQCLANIRTLAIVCTQWGDTGKGKFVDYFAEWADIIARGTGGANAGHTIVLNGQQYIFHLVPSGILYDNQGKVNIIGSGTVIDPGVILQELAILQSSGLPFNHLRISRNAKLVLPQHIVMDRVRECTADGKIGTTGRGIGPAYTDHYDRLALTVNDLLNPDSFVAKLRRNLRDKVQFLRTIDPETIREIMQHEHLCSGTFYDAHDIFNEGAIVAYYRAYGDTLRPMICDTDALLRAAVGKQNILLEGAQGHLLSIDYGTYPFVTSSDCSIQGLAKGVGLSEKQVDLTLGILKAFFMTRVGEGPFPTECGGMASATWCGTKGVNRTLELEKFGSISVNDPDPFRQGIGIRMAGHEYGATTGRPRRTGWLDLPLLRYAVQTGIQGLILTKLDSLDGCEVIKLCTAYEYQGPDYQLGERTLRRGDCIDVAVPHSDVLQHCQPIYREFPDWLAAAEQPHELMTVIKYLEVEVGKPAVILSVGPDRDQTIVL